MSLEFLCRWNATVAFKEILKHYLIFEIFDGFYFLLSVEFFCLLSSTVSRGYQGTLLR
jgi:hypothetical protein